MVLLQKKVKKVKFMPKYENKFRFFVSKKWDHSGVVCTSLVNKFVSLRWMPRFYFSVTLHKLHAREFGKQNGGFSYWIKGRGGISYESKSAKCIIFVKLKCFLV